MYFKDKTRKVFVRMSEEQDNYLTELAEIWGCSKSEMVRKILDSVRIVGFKDENKQINFND